MSAPIEIFTDGACKGNPGVGGWGAVLRYKDRQKEICGGEADTTNNRMELTAVIFALETLKKKCHVRLFTDSQYVQRGMTEWLENWQRRDFRRVKNADLWRRLADWPVFIGLNGGGCADTPIAKGINWPTNLPITVS